MVRTITQLKSAKIFNLSAALVSGFFALAPAQAKADVNGLHIKKDADGFLITQNASDAKVDGFINSMRFDASGHPHTVKLISIGDKIQSVELKAPSLEEINSAGKAQSEITYTACSKLSPANERALAAIIGRNIDQAEDYIDGIYGVHISAVTDKEVDKTFSYRFQQSQVAACNSKAPLQTVKNNSLKNHTLQVRMVKLSGKVLKFLKREKTLTTTLKLNGGVRIAYPSAQVASVDQTMTTQALRFSMLTDAQPTQRIADVSVPAAPAVSQATALLAGGEATSLRFAANMVPAPTTVATASQVAAVIRAALPVKKPVAGAVPTPAAPAAVASTQRGVVGLHRFAATAQVVKKPTTAAARDNLFAAIEAVHMDSGLIAPRYAPEGFFDNHKPHVTAAVISNTFVTASHAATTPVANVAPAQSRALAGIQAMLENSSDHLKRFLYIAVTAPTHADSFHGYINRSAERAAAALVVQARADAIAKGNTDVLASLDHVIVEAHATRTSAKPVRSFALNGAQLRPSI